MLVVHLLTSAMVKVAVKINYDLVSIVMFLDNSWLEKSVDTTFCVFTLRAIPFEKLRAGMSASLKKFRRRVVWTTFRFHGWVVEFFWQFRWGVVCS